jgi:phytoene dehydrogenase-like protein
LKPALATSFRETLARHGLGQTSQRVLEAALWYLGVRDAGECSTLEAAVAIDGVRRGAVCIPVGTAALLDALAERYQRDQGQLRLNTPVARFLVEGGRIGGLVTGDGELIRTRWVVANLSPDILSGGLLPPWHGRFKRRSSLEVSWRPTHSLQALLLTISARYVPSELSGHCFVVRDPSRTARDANVVFVRTSPAERHMQGSDAIRCITAGRFAPLADHDDEASVRAALLEALDQVIPGVADGGGDHRTLLPAELAARWGRPSAAVRYAGEYRDWLGQRGLPHQFEWPGLLVVGEWTYPGRMIANVVEGAMRVAELISQSP